MAATPGADVDIALPQLLAGYGLPASGSWSDVANAYQSGAAPITPIGGWEHPQNPTPSPTPPPAAVPVSGNPFQKLDLQSLAGSTPSNEYNRWLSGITGNNSLDSISNLVNQMNSPSLTKGFGGMTPKAPTYDWGFQW